MTARRGFTLIEVLMVVVIIVIATAIAIPSFTRSFRGAKLRASTRAIVSASRYARSRAVLQQVQAVLLFDTELATIEVITIGSANTSENKFLNDTPADEEEGQPAVESRLKKTMEPDVRIVSVTSDSPDGLMEIDGIYSAIYYPNGLCDQYTVELEDDQQKRVLIEVDPLSGKSAVEFL